MIAVTASSVVEVIRGCTFRYHDEDRLQAGLAAALEAAGHKVTREYTLVGGGRVDLLVDRIAIEVKVGGQDGQVIRQLRRYARCPQIDELVLVTTRARHRPPTVLEGKAVHVVRLLGAGL